MYEDFFTRDQGHLASGHNIAGGEETRSTWTMEEEANDDSSDKEKEQDEEFFRGEDSSNDKNTETNQRVEHINVSKYQEIFWTQDKQVFHNIRKLISAWSTNNRSAVKQERVSVEDTMTYTESVENFAVHSANHIHKYLLDSRATCNFTNQELGVLNQAIDKTKVIVAQNSLCQPGQSGTLLLQLAGLPEEEIPQLDRVFIILQLNKCIISLRQLTKGGYQVLFKGNQCMVINLGGHNLTVREDRDGLFYLQGTIVDDPEQIHATMGTNPNEIWKIDIDDVHKHLGHVHGQQVRLTFQNAGFQLIGELQPCPACLQAKTKQKAVCKITWLRASLPGERIFVDSTGSFMPSIGGIKYWVQANDNKTRMKFCFVTKQRVRLQIVQRDFYRASRSLGTASNIFAVIMPERTPIRFKTWPT